mmetsp:Transcript_60385/g.110848  ORF Transcript_60385/g.110848 Transcript_60385/m.110848 type:complete len:262 (-) Transcript_60385:342-1127(-)
MIAFTASVQPCQREGRGYINELWPHTFRDAHLWYHKFYLPVVRGDAGNKCCPFKDTPQTTEVLPREYSKKCPAGTQCSLGCADKLIGIWSDFSCTARCHGTRLINPALPRAPGMPWVVVWIFFLVVLEGCGISEEPGGFIHAAAASCSQCGLRDAELREGLYLLHGILLQVQSARSSWRLPNMGDKEINAIHTHSNTSYWHLHLGSSRTHPPKCNEPLVLVILPGHISGHIMIKQNVAKLRSVHMCCSRRLTCLHCGPAKA